MTQDPAPGAANYNFDPPFTTNGTYHLQPGSPAIDRILSSGLGQDFDGEPRPQGPRIDIGADEAG